MFSVTYVQEKNRVNIFGFNPKYPLNCLDTFIEFESEKEAKGFCHTINSIEDAIRINYKKEFAVAVYKGVLDITTEDPLRPDDKRIIEDRIQKSLEHMPIADQVIFHTLNKS